jgi:hypothetical protein
LPGSSAQLPDIIRQSKSNAEIHDRVSSMSLATVYKNVRLFVDYGLLLWTMVSFIVGIQLKDRANLESTALHPQSRQSRTRRSRIHWEPV